MSDITSTPADAAPLLGAIVKHKKAAYSGTVLDVVYFDANGDCLATDADDAAKSAGWGIVVSTHDGETTFVSGDSISIVVLGPMAGFSGMVEGAFGFISANAGKLADAAGTVTRRMGYSLESDVFFVLPGAAAPTSA